MFIESMPFSEYLARTETSQSTLKLFRRTPAHARVAMGEKKSTASMALGSAVHGIVLEGREEFVSLSPGIDLRTNVGKAEKAAALASGLPVLKAEEAETARAMARAVLEHPTASKLLAAADHQELSVLWGWQKARLDAIINTVAVVDLKTTDDASPDAFSRSLWKYGYHIQGAHYLEAANEAGMPCPTFLIIAVESDAPYCVAVYEVDIRSLEQGARELEELRATFLQCRETGLYPGYPDGINPIGLPRWAKQQEEY